MSAHRRVLFAGLFHETNTFVEALTPLSDFVVCRGEELLSLSGDSSPMGGALATALGLGWSVLPGVDLRTMPSATATDEVLEFFWHELEAAAKTAAAGGLDAVFLVLHGAMVTLSYSDVEGEILSRLRALPGMAHLPVFGVFDLHANFTARMAEHANCLVAYRQNPHTDAREAATRAVHLLHRSLVTGAIPRTEWVHPPILWPPTGTASATEPMLSLLSLARELEVSNPEFWCVNVIAGFSFADTEEAGVSFTVCTTGASAPAAEALSKLAALAWKNRLLGNRTEAGALEVVRGALASAIPGLTVIAEPADNIGGGAPGDGTGLLRAFLELEVPNAGIALADPEAVEVVRAWAAAQGPGPLSSPRAGRLKLAVGGRRSSLDAGPVELEVEVLSLSGGRFELLDKNSHLASASGDYFEMGASAVVRSGNITLLLTSRPTPPMDLGQWTSQGIDPARFSYLGVKAAVAHRGAYQPIAARLLWADAPGPCSRRLDTLRFQRVRRPVFPLDADARSGTSAP